MRPEEINQKRILLSPLNWGMGHVARCIGLIEQLRKQENQLYIACSASQQAVFEQYFDDLTYIEHAGYPFDFRGKGHFGLDMVNKSSSLFRRLKDERQQTEFMVDENNIDIVLSDHRYGFRSKKVHSIVITHQVNLPVRFHEVPVNTLHKQYLSRFDGIWIMDYADSRLTGKLSRSKRDNLEFIGPYSRFSLYTDRPTKEFEKVLIASGPSVYAQQLIDDVLNSTEYAKQNDMVVIHNGEMVIPKDVASVSLNWREQDVIILKAKHIISRSGYSTIMDCLELDVSATFIATPGQREQEYLKELHS